MASAQPDISCNIFDRDRIGIIGADVFDAFLDISLGGVGSFFFLGITYKKGERQVELTGPLN